MRYFLPTGEEVAVGEGIQSVQFIFLLLLLFVVAFGALARKIQIPYPIVLVIAGAILALIPGIPRITLNPDFIFFVVLPPLLYAAAWNTSWREFQCNLVSISLLAFGLVLFTVIGVAVAAPYLLQGFDWKVGLVLGAIVAPTDALAASSIAQRIGLPKRISDLLEGESLVNDATGLLALEFGVALVMRTENPTVGSGVLRLALLILIGLAVGVGTAWIVAKLERRIDDAPIEIAFSILIPYAVYLAANAIHGSGVLAVVACGLYLRRRSSGFFSPEVRLQVWAVWRSLNFILNGLVFVLIGLQLPYVRSTIRDHSLRELLFYGVVFTGMVIALRMIWTFPGAWLAHFIRKRILHQDYTFPPVNYILVLGWTGMRGVISLAAAMALPQFLPDGTPFPQRNLIIFLAFIVILVTLVLQGLTLPLVVRMLGVCERETPNEEEQAARRIMLETALSYLDRARDTNEKDSEVIYKDLAGHYRQRLTSVTGNEDAGNGITPDQHERLARLSRELLHVERETALRLRDEGQINDEILRKLEYELDLREAGPVQAA